MTLYTIPIRRQWIDTDPNTLTLEHLPCQVRFTVVTDTTIYNPHTDEEEKNGTRTEHLTGEITAITDVDSYEKGRYLTVRHRAFSPEQITRLQILKETP